MGMVFQRFHVRSLPAPVSLSLIYGLFLVAGVAQAAIVPLLPRMAAHFALSASQTALLLALPGLATLAVSVPSGIAADRIGARRVSLGAGALLCLACAAQAMPSLAAVLVGRIVFGVAFGVVWTSGMAWLADLDEARAETAPRALGPAVTCSSVGIMLGPAVGGVLAQHIGLGAPFAVIAIAAAVIVAPLALGTTSVRRATPAPPVQAADLPLEVAYLQPPISDGPAAGGSMSPRVLLALARRPRVAAAAGALVVSGAVSSASQLLVSGGLHRLGLSTGRIGLAFSVAAVCYIAVSSVVVRLGTRAQTLKLNALSSAALAVALVPALASTGTVALVMALMLSAGPRAVISTIAYNLASQREDKDPAHPGSDGVVFGMLNGAWAAATVLMPLLAGAVEQAAGIEVAYLAVIIPSLAVAVWLLAGAAARVPVLRVGLRGWRGLS
ncbi:MAG TPA: MFS transporter [Solirubrobacteraceae bacterium]|jgi:MFS family permease|nr:MFS transporter [Solirubrobacteraceae bacterium]